MAAIDYGMLTILVIDDEPYTRQLIRQMLYQIGIRTVLEAANGKDGLLELLRTRPDIVFCDIHMKPVGGLEVLRQVRAVRIPEIAATPVIMLTADATPEAVSIAKEQAANGYLVKPVALSQLKSRIDAVVAASQKLTDKCR